MQIIGGTINGSRIQDGGLQLYPFTTFTFTNGPATNRNGPTLANLTSSYDTATYSWLTNTAYFNVVTRGLQLWTVPKTGSYQFEVVGAAGGEASGSNVNAGYGAKMIGNIALAQGDKINIVVGQRGYPMSPAVTGGFNGGGGGGSFVFRAVNNNVPLVAAGGGGGGSSSAAARANAGIVTNGIAGTGFFDNATAFSGNVINSNIGFGGVNNITAVGYKAGMGGGWKSDGGGGHALCPYPVTGGLGAANVTPFLGGFGNNTQSSSLVNNQGGGFGGGGGGTGRCGQSGSGGGGGYTGGSMAQDASAAPLQQRGQGGGSYIDTVNVTVVSGSIHPFLANGYVKVTFIG